MPPTVSGVIVIGLSGVRSVLEIGGMTGGVSGDDRGFEREMGDGEWLFCGFGQGVSSVFGADFQRVKEKNPSYGKKNGVSDDDDTADSGGIYFCIEGDLQRYYYI